MGYPPETTNTMSGMPSQYTPDPHGPVRPRNDVQQAYQDYAIFQDGLIHPMHPSQSGYLSNNYSPASHDSGNGIYRQTQPFPSTSNPMPQRPSGVAVVIPSPSYHQSQRMPSVPSIQRQPMPAAQPTVSTPTSSVKPLAKMPPIPQPPTIDYQVLLLTLAEDYLASARKLTSLSTASDRESTTQQYHQQIAAGLACLETVLKQFKPQPQLEASVRLRYASVLYEETENMLEIEQCLSDGMKLCDRYRFFDLKYNMEHLLAQVLFKGSPRASMKFLDGVIKNAEAYQHTAWVYALRFLKVSLLLQLPSHQDLFSALAQLRSISALADESGDRAIVATASTLEALVHLRDSNSAESIEQAQRALALARGLLHDPMVGHVSQLVVLTNIADLSCSIQQFDPAQAVLKMQAMQSSLESPHHDWDKNDMIQIPVLSQNPTRAPHGNGIIRKDLKGSLSVGLSWASWTDLYTLGYLLSSISIAYRNTSDGLRSEQMLKEGLRHLDKNASLSDSIHESISGRGSPSVRRQTLRCYFQLHLVFAFCTRTAWDGAKQQLKELRDSVAVVADESDILNLLLQYVEGIVSQGTGDLNNALSIFQRPCFSITTKSPSPAHTDLAILSTFNAILIVRPSTHPSHHVLTYLFSSLQPHLARIKATKPLLSAYNLILATTPNPTPPTIVRTKQYLQAALQAAKSCSNNQLTCMTVHFMSHKFFKGVVGEQAEKSARASESLARKGMDALWKSVSAGVLGDTLEMAGKGDEAHRTREIGREITEGLPEGLVRWEETAMEMG